MTGVIHTLLLLGVVIGPSDSPPATGTETAAPQEALPPPPPPACIPPAEPVPAPQPQGTPPPFPIVVDKSLTPNPQEWAAEGGWVQGSRNLLERGINALVLQLDRFFGEPAH